MKKQMNEYEKRVSETYQRCLQSGTIKEVPADKRRELVERFVGFYSKFDKRLRKIQRSKIIVGYTQGGMIRVCCTYYNKYYGQVYND